MPWGSDSVEWQREQAKVEVLNHKPNLITGAELIAHIWKNDYQAYKARQTRERSRSVTSRSRLSTTNIPAGVSTSATSPAAPTSGGL